MRRVLDRFRFALIAVARWIADANCKMIDDLREANRLLREQLGGRREAIRERPRDPDPWNRRTLITCRKSKRSNCLEAAQDGACRQHAVDKIVAARSLRLPQGSTGFNREAASR